MNDVKNAATNLLTVIANKRRQHKGPASHGITNILLSVAGLILLYLGLESSGVAGAGELTASAFLLLLFMRN